MKINLKKQIIVFTAIAALVAVPTANPADARTCGGGVSIGGTQPLLSPVELTITEPYPDKSTVQISGDTLRLMGTWANDANPDAPNTIRARANIIDSVDTQNFGPIVGEGEATKLDGSRWILDLPVEEGWHRIRTVLENTGEGAHHECEHIIQIYVEKQPADTGGSTDNTGSNSGDSGGDSSGGDGDSGGGGGGDQGPDPEPRVSSQKSGQVKGAVSPKCTRTGDTKTGDFIQNVTVPAVVERIFGEVFGKKITPVESTYWKQRARCDKATEGKLRGAMAWHKGRGSTGVKSPQVSGAKSTAPSGSLVPRINALFRSVYGRNPSVSENQYWLTRIADKSTETAMVGAMAYHKVNGLSH